MSDASPLRPMSEQYVSMESVPDGGVWGGLRLWPIDEQEWANGLTHAVGCLIGLAGAWILLQQVAGRSTPGQLVACVVYCVSLIAVYAASTLSHWARSPAWRRRFRMWDQGLIYLLIAGTYTPIGVSCLDGWWHVVTVLMWGLAIAGFLSKTALAHRVDSVTLWLYLALGWLPAVIVPRWLAVVPPYGMALMLAGGLAYTLGSALLAHDHRAPFLHAGWHVAVILGSALHYWAIWLMVVPGT